MKRKTLLFTAFITAGSALAQDSAVKKNNTFNWFLFADIYFSYDFNQPAGHLKPSFLYNYNLHNKPACNLALARASWESKRLRSNFGLMAGTYSRYNLAAEPEWLRHLYEATIGIKISRKKNLWIDAGVMPSHIGFETAVSVNNTTLTRSMAADNSPYFETGAKLTYTTADGSFLISALALNGWQRIKRAAGNKSICAGTQLTYTPNNKTSVNWSTFIGNDKPDSARQNRWFNNFYGIFTPHPKWNIMAGFDIGWQKKLRQSGYHTWLTPLCAVQYKVSEKWSIAARCEYYSDRYHVIVQPEIPNMAFSVSGFSFNIDRKLGKLFLWRVEFRTLKNREAVFIKNNAAVKKNTAVTTSLGFKLN